LVGREPGSWSREPMLRHPQVQEIPGISATPKAARTILTGYAPVKNPRPCLNYLALLANRAIRRCRAALTIAPRWHCDHPEC
jgi:hypothetical protein